MWGAGETVVSRWQSEGCHTLADVATRSDLSAQQVGSVRCRAHDNVSTLALSPASVCGQLMMQTEEGA